MPEQGPNVFIEFSILENSNLEILKKEMSILIDSGRLIFLWSKTVSIDSMASWIVEHKLQDYIWGYKVKDSVNYSSPDFVIDNDEKFVNRFRRNGIEGNVMEKL